MFSQHTYLALIALVSIAQASSSYGYSIYDTPGPVIPQFGPDFPFNNLSNNSKDAASTISQAKLGGFCNELLSSESDSDDDSGEDSESPPRPGKRRLRSRGSSYNSNQSYNANTNSGGSGSTYSSSYSNSNGHISGQESGYPGNKGQGYSYTYSNEGNGPSGSSYTLNGLRVPKALQQYSPKAIRMGCERATSGPSNPQTPSQGTSPPSASSNPGPPGPSGPKVSFESIYYGYGTDLPIHQFEQPGLLAVPYVQDQFSKYRQACGNSCARVSSCGGFVVSTDFTNNSCALVIGTSVGRADFIDQGQARGYGQHTEGYRKITDGQPVDDKVT